MASAGGQWNVAWQRAGVLIQTVLDRESKKLTIAANRTQITQLNTNFA